MAGTLQILWDKISDIGSEHPLPDYLDRKRVVLNRLALTIAVSLFINVNVLQFYSPTGPAGGFIAILLTLVLVKFGYFHVARWVSVLLAPFMITFNFSGMEPTVTGFYPAQVALFGTLALPLALFDPREYLKTAFSVSITVFLFFFYPYAHDQLADLDTRFLSSVPQYRYFLASFGFVVLLGGMTYLLAINYQAEQRIGELLHETQEKNEELRVSLDTIAHQREAITDSIQYARRIRDAMMQSTEVLDTQPLEYFILNRPRDIVGGDFYWFTQLEDRLLIAVADCTGHGVPGAFMSVLGNSLFTQLATRRRMSDPAAFLEHLNDAVRTQLKQYDAHAQQLDGMDVALVTIDWKARTLTYAGANRPLLYFRNGTCEEYKPTKRPIGGRHFHDTPFTNTVIQFQTGDQFYLFSDGVTDQLGGPKSRKYTLNQLKEELQQIIEAPMQVQLELFSKNFDTWKSNQEQLDDVLLFGVRIK